MIGPTPPLKHWICVSKIVNLSKSKVQVTVTDSSITILDLYAQTKTRDHGKEFLRRFDAAASIVQPGGASRSAGHGAPHPIAGGGLVSCAIGYRSMLSAKDVFVESLWPICRGKGRAHLTALSEVCRAVSHMVWDPRQVWRCTSLFRLACSGVRLQGQDVRVPYRTTPEAALPWRIEALSRCMHGTHAGCRLEYQCSDNAC